MEPPSWTAPYLDVLFTPPVSKTYTFLKIPPPETILCLIVDISHPVYTNIRRLFSPKQNNF